MGCRTSPAPSTGCASQERRSRHGRRRDGRGRRRRRDPLRPGDEVFGWAKGSYAEYTAATEDSLALKPANLTFERPPPCRWPASSPSRHSATTPTSGRDQTVLVNGASGGIGTFAVQIAKALGAEVTGVSSTRNVDLVRSIGADHVIDYTTEDFTKAGRQYDVILDNVSNHSLGDLRHVLTPTGTLVPNGGGFDNRWLASGGRLVRAAVLFQFGGQTLGNFLMSTNHADLATLAGMIEAGTVTPVMDRIYPLSETAQALAHVGTGHARGKVAITV